MTEQPLISILTPAYNAAAYLPELLASVGAQDYPHYEHVVIDDGSTDGTARVLAAAGDARLRWYSRANRGQYETQNELIGRARGEILTFICADDLYATPRALSIAAGALGEGMGADVVFGRTPRLVMAEGGAYTFDPDFPGMLARPLMRRVLTIQHCSLFVRAALVRAQQLYFDPWYRQRGDWDWLIRMFAATARTRRVGEALSYWRFHAGQTSAQGRARGREENARLCAVHGIDRRAMEAALQAARVYAQAVHSLALLRHRGPRAVWRKAAASLGRPLAVR